MSQSESDRTNPTPEQPNLSEYEFFEIGSLPDGVLDCLVMREAGAEAFVAPDGRCYFKGQEGAFQPVKAPPTRSREVALGFLAGLAETGFYITVHMAATPGGSGFWITMGDASDDPPISISAPNAFDPYGVMYGEPEDSDIGISPMPIRYFPRAVAVCHLLVRRYGPAVLTPGKRDLKSEIEDDDEPRPEDIC